MKASDLMIGDFVEHDNVIKRVNVIWGTREVSLNDPYKIYGSIYSDKFPIEEIKPIPLTKEILEKNGFTKELDADGIHYRFTLIDENIRFSILYARSVFQWLGPLDFKYVHELQHALRLCGIEKEIEL